MSTRFWNTVAILCAVAPFAVLAALLFFLRPAYPKDDGQWENSDPVISKWYRTLKMPDKPDFSCCGEADAYWADIVLNRDGKTVAVITDDRDDAPLRRPHVPNGTEIEVPDYKLKWDQGNPTGHGVIFLSHPGEMGNRDVYCFVYGGGV